MALQEAIDVAQLREKLRLTEQKLEREMRARGFDPEQLPNVALTTSLAKLHNEVEGLRSQLATITMGEPDSYE